MYEQADSGLRRDLDRLQGEVADLTTYELPSLSEKLEKVTGKVRGLVERAGVTESDVRRHGTTLDDIERALRQMRTSVTWMERHIRASGSATVADLDAVPARLQRAAAEAEAGRAARERLLTDIQRAVREASITAHRDAVTAVGEATAALLDACNALAELDWRDDERHAFSRRRYEYARDRWRSAAPQPAQLAPHARHADRELAADDELREELAERITAGAEAWTLLTTSLRTTIAAAASDGNLLPVWLHESLGPMPPPGRTREWIELATEVLAYRLTYHIDDPLIAIDETPPDAPIRRWTWAAKIKADIELLNA